MPVIIGQRFRQCSSVGPHLRSANSLQRLDAKPSFSVSVRPGQQTKIAEHEEARQDPDNDTIRSPASSTC